MTTPEPNNESRLSRKTKISSERLCIVTRDVISRDDGLRFVADPDGNCVFDVNAKLPGRGVWVKPQSDVLAKAIKTGAFARGLKMSIKPTHDLEVAVEKGLLQKCQHQISLAKKAGELIQGRGAIETFALRASPHALGSLIQAGNGDSGPRSSLARLVFEQNPDVHWAGAVTGQELGGAVGRIFLAHGLIKSGRMAKLWQAAYNKLAGFRPTPEIAWKTELNPINSNIALAD